MAETLCNIAGGSGPTLKAMGFINVPSGNWKLKSTLKGDTFPGLGSNVIPLTMDIGTSGNGHSSSGSQSYTTYNSYGKINGVDFVRATCVSHGWDRWSVENCSGSTGFSGGTTNNYAFIPYAYGMDLTLTQKNTTNTGATYRTWLQK